jgi:hypothetical protein
LFLQRGGSLSADRTGWTLRVEPDASDVLLSEIPWSIEQIVLPWLGDPLRVMWL